MTKAIFVQIRLYLLFFLVASLWAQQPAAKKVAVVPKHLTVDNVIGMVKAGLSEDVIIARLRKEEKPFDLEPDDLIRLKNANVSDAIVKVMLDPKAPPATAPPTQPAPQQVVVQTAGIAGLPVGRPSGATPSPGTNAAGDPNDPMVPHDSGIYLYTKDRDGKPQMIVLERAAYTGAKTGGMLGSAMTYGIKKVKTKAVIAGQRASIRVADTAPVFYFYFDDKQAGLGKTYFGVGNLSNPNQFALLRLDVTKTGRETIIGAYSSLGSSSGNDTKAMVQFKSERIRPGLYKVSLDSIKEGEYCFLSAGGGVTSAGPYGAMATTTTGTDIFDFGVSVN
jgi:hypothetical protein